MEEFPTEVELEVAAALLLLSLPPPSSTTTPSLPCDKLSLIEFGEEKRLIEMKKIGRQNETSFETTPSYNSTLTTDHRVNLRIMHLKVARRARSKVIYLSTGKGKQAPSNGSRPEVSVNQKAVKSSQTTTEGSCLSTGGTSEISGVVEQKNRRRVAPPHLRRNAEAIMRLLSRGGGIYSEVRIRQLLGDSPDTSKALRMLLRMEKVKRSGAGGRADPYRYMMAAQQQQADRHTARSLITSED